MYIHFILMGCIFLFGLALAKWKNGGKVFMITYFLLLFIFAAFRDVAVGNDTLEYVRVFDAFSGLSSFAYNLFISRYEPGYVLFNTILKTFTKNYTILFACVSGFYLYAVGRFINKYSKFIWMSVFLFYSLGVYFWVFNLFRQCIAICFFLFAIDFVLEEKPVKYVLIILGAALFHTTALTLLPLYWWRRQKTNIKFQIIFFFLLVLGLLVFDRIINIGISHFPQYFKYYASSKYAEGGTRLASILKLLVIVAIFIYGKIFHYIGKTRNTPLRIGRLEKVDPMSFFEIVMLINISVLMLSLKFNLLDRISDYFYAVAMIYLPNSVAGAGKLAYSASLVIVVLFILYITIILYYRPEWSGIFPYRFKLAI